MTRILRWNLRGIWHELIIIGTVIILSGTVTYLIFFDLPGTTEQTYTQYDLIFAENNVDELIVVPAGTECSEEYSIVADTTNTTVQLETGPTDERTEIDDVLAQHEFTFCLNDDTVTERIVLHEHDNEQLTLTLDEQELILTGRTINTTILP